VGGLAAGSVSHGDVRVAEPGLQLSLALDAREYLFFEIWHCC
jgi:hypothetical protein